MFNNKPDNETDFCESYKSQVLNDNVTERESSFNTILKTLIIILLLAIVVGLSIYGYNHLINKPITTLNSEDLTPPSSIQISDDELKVTMEEPTKSVEVLNIVEKPEEKLVESIVEELQKENVEVIEAEPKVEIEPQITPTSIQEEVNTIIDAPVSSQENESDIDKIANALKLSIAADEEKKNDTLNIKIEEESLKTIKLEVIEEKSLEVPSPSSPEAKYLEELAELSKEIDKEMN